MSGEVDKAAGGKMAGVRKEFAADEIYFASDLEVFGLLNDFLLFHQTVKIMLMQLPALLLLPKYKFESWRIQ